MTERITATEFHQASGAADWRVLGEGACAWFRTGSFAAGVRLASAIADLPGLDGHGPDVDIRRDGVAVRLVTRTAEHYGLTGSDLDLARRISALARDLGVPTDPAAVRSVQVTVDALDLPAVTPFWRALLGYEHRAGSPEDLVDPRGRGPAFWFQRMDAPRPQRNRMHVDVWVPYDGAEARVAAAVAAGGRLVDDAHAPSFWVLADPEGNEACVGAAGWLDPAAAAATR